MRAAAEWSAALAGEDGTESSQDRPYTAFESEPVRRAKDSADARRLLDAELGNFVAVRRLAAVSGMGERAEEPGRMLAARFRQL